MSRKERNRMTIMAGVKRKELSQVQAGELMGLGYRQTKRLWRRYQDEGDAELIHRLRGRAGLRRKAPAVRAQVLAWHAQERYADFGPTLLAEELAKEGIEVDHPGGARRNERRAIYRKKITLTIFAQWRRRTAGRQALDGGFFAATPLDFCLGGWRYFRRYAYRSVRSEL